MSTISSKNTDLENSSMRQKWRIFNDKLAHWVVSLGGLSVIVAITLIFFYLLIVVLPLFESAEIKKLQSYQLSAKGSGNTIHYILDEQAKIGVRFTDEGKAQTFDTSNGHVLSESTLVDSKINSFGIAESSSGIIGFGLEDGSIVVVKTIFDVSYIGDKKVVTPKFENILGEDPVEIFNDQAIEKISIQYSDDGLTLLATNVAKEFKMVYFEFEESMFDDEVSFEQYDYDLPDLNFSAKKLFVDATQRMAFVFDDKDSVYFYNISDREDIKLYQSKSLVAANEKISNVQFASGSFSLLIGYDSGRVAQWFPVRDKNNNYSLEFVRDFKMDGAPIDKIVSEYFRKAFVSLSRSGELGLHHLTAHNTVYQDKIIDVNVKALSISPRADHFLLETESGDIHLWHISNEYPEISVSSLWNKVWYEGYAEPDYVWQSSSASNEFEPKFSLVPLSFGTLKAAFYAMLVAMPLAILGAIYTAYFMSSRLRQTVKPTIEIMEALPTVILGFLAGLWFAPFLESHMPGVFSVALLLPIAVLLFAYAWHKLPASMVGWVPDGWQPILLLPVIILFVWGAIAVSPMLESAFFGGNLPIWLNDELGIGYDQRNAMVVGFAMGFAVIPTIFSIAEDAIFSVPKHLTMGSLALGATPWQTLTRVVILTASPGIFSAVMIGFGRAVGETMIVLMATGNTPVLDFSFFEGMRTFSANVAVEMPESEVGSTHYRVLFLAALILFLFTFIFNTIAEVVRQRLRSKYSSL